MFKKTKIQLTALNAIIFFIVIAMLSTIIYIYSETMVYKNVDDSLLEAAKNPLPLIMPMQNNDGPTIFEARQGQNRKAFKNRDLRVDINYWNEHNQLLSFYGESVYTENVKAFVPNEIEVFQKVETEDHSFQTYTIALSPQIVIGNQVVISKIQFVRETKSEEALLHNLLMILIIGNVVGAIAVVGIGYYLSGRALIPINKAWEKQQQFVSDASHELRTPLTIIQTRSDLLLREPESTIEDKILDVSAISKETRRLSKLVTNLLILARSDSNQIELNKIDFRLDNLLNEIVEQFVDIAEFQEKELSLEVEEGLEFYGDKERIHQLMVILIDNALKFTKAEGNIKINCYGIGNLIQITVADTGVGINPECLPRVFDRFYQGDKSRTNNDGTGLGLSIAKWIVEKHAGKINVESVFGEGTIFNITLPKTKKN
ncbi:MAG: two component system histidine kinase [Bacillales bacterium]|jgi:signal transduction histidine kinase|nr:two component system histidine kinase [Bacillales bacterium]